MKILIINGNPKRNYPEFDLYLEQLKKIGNEKDIAVELLLLRDFNLHDCIGCYSCWLKTPGICFYHDDQELILREFLASNVVILASPIIMGFVSALLKCFNDRLLPLGHPFLYLKEDKMAHIPRYTHYPKTVLLLDDPKQEESNARTLIEEVYQRSSRELRKIFTTKNKIQEIIDEITHY
ncbi:MAG: flavodoxin family protein [Oligoflexia bacterium]|nr:flavodoxin family protein [Oligoflexia bacterium]